jgi:hypothetical protein
MIVVRRPGLEDFSGESSHFWVGSTFTVVLLSGTFGSVYSRHSLRLRILSFITKILFYHFTHFDD